TELSIQRLSVNAGERYDVFDTLTPGLVLRVGSKGRKSWSLMYRIAGRGEDGMRGKLQRLTLGQYPIVKLEEAREKARMAYQHAEEGNDPSDLKKLELLRRNACRFEVVCEEFIELYVKPQTKKWKDTESLLRRFVIPEFIGLQISEIDRGKCFQLLDTVTAKRGEAIAREVRKHLVKFLNWSADRGYIAVNPLAGAKMPSLVYVQRERVLSAEEIEKIWRAAGEIGYPFGPFVKLLILTGQRRNEIAKMQVRWFTKVDGVPAIEIPGAIRKTKRPQLLPVTEEIAKVLSDLPVYEGADHLFSTTAGHKPISGFSKAKTRIDRIVGFSDWTYHDIRRTVATELARRKVPQEHIERVLGHEVGGVQGTYNLYSYHDEKREALALWGAEWADK
ncbi:tyrosine-type recombinase/integrase, partial [Ahrensia kielensis]|uniref:tyrosine-type recombinase/integrase n=1 Tax=Ahrensia kielensis TaxID=76980 RepID=UPI00036735FD